MNKLIQQLSPRTEFITVTTTGFGYFTFTSLVWFLYILSAPPNFSLPAPSDSNLFSIGGYEIIALLLIAKFLSLRGWSLRDLNLQVSWKLTGAGILLALVYYLIYYFLWIAVNAMAGPFNHLWAEPTSSNAGLSLTAIIISSIINPLFEESLVIGYILKSQTARKGVWYAINISILIRLIYHLYQGPLVVIGIVPLGWLFAYVYARWNRLWPIVVAHGLLDFIALSAN
jgi:membrane protease YdiL (CAAX protease family)